MIQSNFSHSLFFHTQLIALTITLCLNGCGSNDLSSNTPHNFALSPPSPEIGIEDDSSDTNSSDTDSDNTDSDNTGSSGRDSNNEKAKTSENGKPEQAKLELNWNNFNDERFCQALQYTNYQMTLGATFTPRETLENESSLSHLKITLESLFQNKVKILKQNNILATMLIQVSDCSLLKELRSLSSVEFVEPLYTADLIANTTNSTASTTDSTVSTTDLTAKALSTRSSSSTHTTQLDQEELDNTESESFIDTQQHNPAFYLEADTNETYSEYVSHTDPSTAEIMKRHGIDKIYDEYQHFGKPGVGVAVVDNGVSADYIDTFSQGQGQYSTQGFLKPFAFSEQNDGIHPQRYDLFGLNQLVDYTYNHGTLQTKHVYSIAPNIDLMTVRASYFVMLLLPEQFQGAIDAIISLAENPTMRIISFSMGTIIYHHELARAIDYFISHDKIFVSAAGSSLPIAKDLAKVIFPAHLPSTISATGIKDTEMTDGEFELGFNAHGGTDLDFVVEPSTASSEAVSTTAAMIALLWSANPSLNRQEIIDILIQSSTYYSELGEKHPIYGWGKVDMYKAYQAVLGTL